MGVYGTQPAATPIITDKIVFSDAGITGTATLQQVLDLFLASFDATDVVIVDAGTVFTATTVEGALAELEAAIAASVTGVASVNGETGAVTIDAGDIDVVDAGTHWTATDVEGVLAEIGAANYLSNVSEDTSPTLGGVLDAANFSVENVGAIESYVVTVATTGATETLDLSTASVFDCTMDQACAFTFSNPAPSGDLTAFILVLRGAFTPSFTNTLIWPDASAATYTTPSVYVFWTLNGGTSYFASQVGKAFA